MIIIDDKCSTIINDKKCNNQALLKYKLGQAFYCKKHYYEFKNEHELREKFPKCNHLCPPCKDRWDLTKELLLMSNIEIKWNKEE